ncbi:MAG: iron-sulfur cluster assembly protein [Dehalococcoidia bacterium]
MDKGKILEVLNRVYDPDYIDRSVLDMGLVTEDDITIKDNRIEVAYGLTAPMCPFSAAIGLMIKYALEKKLGVPVTVNLKAGHHQEGVVAELLQDPQRSEELMRKLTEFGILERCVRL